MKIVCEASVHNRLAPNVNSRPQQSTIAIGVHPPGSKDPENVFVIHFPTTKSTGTRYKIKRNIEQVFTKFMNDGKATISFKQPQHNLLIRCDPVQLKCFLRTLKMAIEGNVDPQKLGLSSLAVTPVPRSNLPAKKMTITKPGEYPVKGLPRTLISLTVTGIRKHSIESQILSLAHLQVLHLNNNCIGRVPKKLGEMRLIELDLSQNNLGASTFIRDWSWTDGPIKQTLQHLNISTNHLYYFPYKLVKLQRLHTLTISDNDIERLPFAVRRLKNLRFLNLANNKLCSLPNVMSRMPFNTINICGDRMFAEDGQSTRSGEQIERRDPAALWQWAARSVISNRIPYSSNTLPNDIIVLLEEAPFCECGKLCLPTNENISPRAKILSLKVSQLDCSKRLDVLGDVVYCNDYCRSIYQR